MIKGIGIDLVDLNRLQTLDQKFIHRVLSDEELTFYQNITSPQTKLTYLGGRFAAKEAIFKAISKGPGNTNYKDFSVLNDENGKPYIKTSFFKNQEIIHLSIAHTDTYAIAYVMIEVI
jgi:holo-[acyl-carrier protein] synthase